MKCIIKLKYATDKPYWVNRKKFYKYVDQKNLAQRESKILENCYDIGLLITKKNGEWYFEPPIIYLNNRRICFTGGRHRTIVLSRHLDVLPMALRVPNVYPFCQSVLDEIIEREIEMEEVFQLPDLETRDFRKEKPVSAKDAATANKVNREPVPLVIFGTEPVSSDTQEKE